MPVVEIKEFEEEFVLYFGSKPNRINAYTLASSLVSIADAVKSANSLINPGYNVEVVVEAFGQGSFKVKVKTLYEGAKNLFSKDNLKQVTLGVIAAYVFQHTLAPDVEVNVVVNENEVVIEQGETKVVVPREVHDCVQEVEKSEKFKQSIGLTKQLHSVLKGVEKSCSKSRLLLLVPSGGFLKLLCSFRTYFYVWHQAPSLARARASTSFGSSSRLGSFSSSLILRQISISQASASASSFGPSRLATKSNASVARSCSFNASIEFFKFFNSALPMINSC